MPSVPPHGSTSVDRAYEHEYCPTVPGGSSRTEVFAALIVNGAANRERPDQRLTPRRLISRFAGVAWPELAIRMKLDGAASARVTWLVACQHSS